MSRLYNDEQLNRLYDCQDFLLGKTPTIEIGHGFASIKDEYRSLRDTLRAYYHFELTAEGIYAYLKEAITVKRMEG